MSVRDVIQAAAGSAGDSKTYIEDVFSTYLYTGNGTYSPNAGTNVINNEIDLAGKGGMVWCKNRSSASNNVLFDTSRGISQYLFSNTTDAQSTNTGYGITSFNSNGFTLQGNAYGENANSSTIASWTFRKAPKFFDVVTYTGNAVAGRTVAHNLGSVPGMMIIKNTTTGGTNWAVYHRSIGNTGAVYLNHPDPTETNSLFWNNTSPTSTNFTLGGSGWVNNNGDTYVAYLFAHDTTTDGLIQCGSFTTDASGNATVNLGWEPQWVMEKNTAGGVLGWAISDSMRGMTANTSGSAMSVLRANTTNAESATYGYAVPNATGFSVNGAGATQTYIYMAIRRGPMRTPTDGTKVFSPNVVNAATGTKTTVNFPIDTQILNYRPGDAANSVVITRLVNISTNSTASGYKLITSSTAAEGTTGSFSLGWDNTGFGMPSAYANSNTVFWNFRRAPGFFDVVCYTGDGTTGRAVNHSLGVTPELVIVKIRDLAGLPWLVWGAPLGTVNALALNETTAPPSYGGFQGGSMTATTFNVAGINTNRSGSTFVSYLFASCPGVSKVGSYTGTGSTQTISCGFTGGARFVLIKRTDSTGAWFVFDTARGITSGNDPYLMLNATNAESSAFDILAPNSSGFSITSSDVAVNGSGGTYIYLAIA